MTLHHRAQSGLEQSGRIYGLERLRRVQRWSDVKEHVNSMVFLWCTHGACMDNGDEEQGLGYGIKAHVNSILALRQTYGRLVMDMRTGHGHQGRMHSRCVVVAQTMNTQYKQPVEYCCGSLSSSLVNYTTRVLHQIFAFEIYLQCCYWILVQWLP